MSQPDYYSPPPTSSALTQLKIAAIITIVGASLGWLWSLGEGGLRAYLLITGKPIRQMGGGQFSPEATKALVEIGLGFEILTVLLAPIVILGAVQMLRHKSHGFARVSAVVAMLPISTFCCCFLTLPMAIWSLVLLSKPEVKDAFHTTI